MDQPKSDAKQTKTFLLRMSESHYDNLKAESQRINVSMTAMLNFIIDDYVKRQKPNNGTEQDHGTDSV